MLVHELGDVLVAECEAIRGAVAGVGDAGFGLETNCPPWTLKELVVHTWQTLLLPPSFNSSDKRPATATDWYRRPERETEQYRRSNVDRARDAASKFPTGGAAADALVAAGEAVRQRLNTVSLERVIAHPAVGAITLGDFVVTRVISVAVHGLDVAITLSTDPFITPAALDVTARVIEELLARSAGDLGWTKDQLVLWGTGRADVPAERAPADVRAKLPVIS